MASVIKKRNRWEIRESIMTAVGPRSRTLATFSVLDPVVLATAESRAERPFDAAAVELSARRKGAPVADPPADRAARDLIAAIDHGASLRPGLAAAVVVALGGAVDKPLSTTARDAVEWAGSDQHERAAALEDLLLLADAVPDRGDDEELAFPRIAA